LGTVRELLAGREQRALVTSGPAAPLREVIARMKALGISQIPIVEGRKLHGIVAEVDLLRALVSGSKTLDSPIDDLVENDYVTLTPNTKIELLQAGLADAKVAIVEEGDQVVGIVTKIDLIDFLARRVPAPSVVPGG
jgi:cystathionine beta-synthase